MYNKTTQTWLKTGAIIMMAFGVTGLTGLIPTLSGLATFLIDTIIWPIDGAQNLQGPETKLLLAIFSGVLLGWGLMIWQLATHLYPKDPGLTRTLILTSIGTWFVIDSAASLYAGAPLNAVFNLGFLALFFIPLWDKSKNEYDPA